MRRKRSPLGDTYSLWNLFVPSTPLDPVFVAIDFEATEIIKNGFRDNGFRDGNKNSQVGLAILDTRSLNAASELTTFNFITGDDAYFEKSVRRYSWGTAEKLRPSSMLSKINACLKSYQDRNIFLIGHWMSGDLDALSELGFDFGRITQSLDTCLLLRRLQLRRPSLYSLLAKLDFPCSHMKFHNAGNDANLTLRALLLLGIKATEKTGAKGVSERVERLWMVAMRDVILRRLCKYMRRSFGWTRSLEEQEEIREQRRQKREELALDVDLYIESIRNLEVSD